MNCLRDNDMMSLIYSIKVKKYNLGAIIYKEGN